MRIFVLLRASSFAATALWLTSAMAQVSPGAPPVVGVVKAEFKPMAESTEINGRIQARDRVDLVARVTAFMNAVSYTQIRAHETTLHRV
jgi:membrane fusion protein (multidrug efflux system)